MMDYRLVFTADDDMPLGHDWMLCRMDGTTVLHIRRSSRYEMTDDEFADLLRASWAGARELRNRLESADVG